VIIPSLQQYEEAFAASEANIIPLRLQEARSAEFPAAFAAKQLRTEVHHQRCSTRPRNFDEVLSWEEERVVHPSGEGLAVYPWIGLVLKRPGLHKIQ
jgi:hypothetical protein